MDLEQLIKQRDELVAEAEKVLEGRQGAHALDRPIELQEAQAARIEGRIVSLEAARAELAKSIDSELQDLKLDLEQRRRKIDLDRKEFEKRAASGGESPPTKATPARGEAPKTTAIKAKGTTARQPDATRKPAKGIALRAAPKVKDKGAKGKKRDL